MATKKLSEWISPLEASLEMSARYGHYISPDDIKQARKRMPEGAYISISKRGSVYKRDCIRTFEIKKREEHTPPKEVIVSWLWQFPETIEHLEQEGHSLPLKEKEEALTELEKQRDNKQKNPKPKKIDTKTA